MGTCEGGNGVVILGRPFWKLHCISKIRLPFRNLRTKTDIDCKMRGPTGTMGIGLDGNIGKDPGGMPGG